MDRRNWQPSSERLICTSWAQTSVLEMDKSREVRLCTLPEVECPGAGSTYSDSEMTINTHGKWVVYQTFTPADRQRGERGVGG